LDAVKRSWPHLPSAAVQLARLNRQQWLPPDRLRALQWRRLRAIVRHAELRSPFYREVFRDAGFTSPELRGWEDFGRLPVTPREALQRSERLVCEGYDPDRLRKSRTSGSTGVPTATYFDGFAWTLARHVLKLRARLACGLRPWDRVAVFQEDVPNGFHVAALGRVASVSLHRRPSELAGALTRFAPTALYGPPSHLDRLSGAGIHLPSVRRVFTSAEMLDEGTRRRLTAAFGTPPLDVYGCTEVKEVAWQCGQRDAYHVNAEWVIVEVSDGSILLTSLYNRAMPLLRYRVGDTGREVPGMCPCGRGLPLMFPVLGRSVDYLRLPGGGFLSPYTLTCAVEVVPGMRQYQIVQRRMDEVSVRVVPDEAFTEETPHAIRAALAAALAGARVSVEVVESIPREPSGKFRIVRSELNDRPR
jgi:phenylacetate-CoA ligase